MDYPSLDHFFFADPELAGRLSSAIRHRSDAPSQKMVSRLVDMIVQCISQEISFGYSVAEGLIALTEKLDFDTIEKYLKAVKDAGREGPAFGKIIAEHFANVLLHGEADSPDHFFHTISIMKKKGIYTLTRPLECYSRILADGDQRSASALLQLLAGAFSHPLNYNQCLHLTYLIPKATYCFPRDKRPWQLRFFRQIIKTDIKLADAFVEGMKNGLCLLDELSLERFLSVAMDKYAWNRMMGARFIALESNLGKETCEELQVTVPLSRVRYSLHRYLRARIGKPVSVGSIKARPVFAQTADLSDTHIYSDGQWIYLPETLTVYPRKKDNIALYKAIVKLEAGYLEIKTFDFDLERLLDRVQNTPLGTMDIPRFPLDFILFLHRCRQSLKDPRNGDFQRFFNLFHNPELCRDLFSIYEQGRIRRFFSDHRQGIVRDAFPMFRKEALKMAETCPSWNLVFALYCTISLGIAVEAIPFGHPRITGMVLWISSLFHEQTTSDDTVETSAILVLLTYNEVEAFYSSFQPNWQSIKSYDPMNMPFHRIFRPETFFSSNQKNEKKAFELKQVLEKSGIKTYRSDIRNRLIEKHGTLNSEDIEELILQADANEQAQPLSDKPLVQNILKMIESPVAEAVPNPSSDNATRHREWNYRMGDYLYDHVRVQERRAIEADVDFYRNVLVQYRGLVKKIRYAFELLKPEGLIILRRWVEGDHFDYQALTNFIIDKKAGITPSDRLYIKRVKHIRDVAVLLLVDLSRSTANLVPGTEKSVLDVEKEAVVLFCEALQVVGDQFAIAGFSGTGRLGVDYFRIKNFNDTMNDTIRRRISGTMHHRNTRMGAAIRHAVRDFDTVESGVRLLIILSDGFPNDTDYKKEYAAEDTRKAIAEARSKRIHTRVLTVNLSKHVKLEEVYGSLQHNSISDVRELPDKLLRIYSNLTRY